MATLLELASHYEKRAHTALLVKLAKYSEQLLLDYLDQVPCVFAYRLADTEENQKRGRVGRLSGFRQGVRNPAFIPASLQAKSTSRSSKYYDLGRQAWRSWRRGAIVSVTAFWSVERQEFVDTPEQAGITAGKPFAAAPKEKPVVSAERKQRTAKREAAKRQREQTRNRRLLRS
jgi:hypothetical protein